MWLAMNWIELIYKWEWSLLKLSLDNVHFTCIALAQRYHFYYNSLLSSSWDVTRSIQPTKIQIYRQTPRKVCYIWFEHTTSAFMLSVSLSLFFFFLVSALSQPFVLSPRNANKWMEACDFLCGCRWINHHTDFDWLRQSNFAKRDNQLCTRCVLLIQCIYFLFTDLFNLCVEIGFIFIDWILFQVFLIAWTVDTITQLTLYVNDCYFFCLLIFICFFFS